MIVLNNVEELADVIFKLFPRKILKKFEKEVFGNKLTLKDRFLARCYYTRKTPRHSAEMTTVIVKRILKDNDFSRKREFDLSLLDCLTRDVFNEQKRFVYRGELFKRLEDK